MTDRSRSQQRCNSCTFWRRTDSDGGACHRRAPSASASSDEIAHWPRTHDNDACGEWNADGSIVTLYCGACVYWRQPEHGMSPVDRKDQPHDWWAHAGRCIRLAPSPDGQPGNRAFWRATHEADGCFDGAAR